MGTFTSETIRSLDEFKATFKNGSLRPAVLKKDGLYVGTTTAIKMDAFFHK